MDSWDPTLPSVVASLQGHQGAPSEYCPLRPIFGDHSHQPYGFFFFPPLALPLWPSSPLFTCAVDIPIATAEILCIFSAFPLCMMALRPFQWKSRVVVAHMLRLQLQRRVLLRLTTLLIVHCTVQMCSCPWCAPGVPLVYSQASQISPLYCVLVLCRSLWVQP